MLTEAVGLCPQTAYNDAYRRIMAPAQAFVMSRAEALAGNSALPVSMRAKRLAHPSIELGFPGAKPRAVGAGSAAALCRARRVGDQHNM